MSPRTLLALPSALLSLVTLGALPGCAGEATASDRPVLEAAATLRDLSGRTVGTVSLAQRPSGVVAVEVVVAGVAVGTHGIHLHAVGSCEASGSTAFGAAGGHFNPHGTAHGLDNPRGAHGGDLPNLVVGSDGTGRLAAETTRATLTAGATSLLDADGTAVVIHAGADDQVSDPAGNSGARIACGVLASK